MITNPLTLKLNYSIIGTYQTSAARETESSFPIAASCFEF